MSFRQKLRDEIKAVTLAALYFATWIGVLMLLKVLVLEEYRIEFHAWSLVLVGALVLAKVVLVLEHVSLGAGMRTRPAWVDVILRTALYAAGVFVVLVFEKAFEGRHENGGFSPSLVSLFQRAEGQHDLPDWCTAWIQRAVRVPAVPWRRRTNPAVLVTPSGGVKSETRGTFKKNVNY